MKPAPCNDCLDQFISTRHVLHSTIQMLQTENRLLKAENARLREKNADLVAEEIRLRLDRHDPPNPHTLTLGQKLRQGVEQQRQQAISKQEGAAS